ncbi:MarR family winged helix-turn-helix transcriptional regulator [Phenylobacterium sp.]|uniref:MarR family winged helix-turn-helix transcriptional regulator n=1 Tax=Phenylobacterium sp. TaxID=1871053 RepID=UPI0035B0DD03
MKLKTPSARDAAPEGGAAGVDPLRLDLQLCFALYSAANTVTRLYRPLLEPLGLTYPQYLTMMALWEKSPRPMAELGEALGLDSGTLTPLLKRLEAAGLVARARDAADERRVTITLTEAGAALKAKAAHVPAELACQLGCDLEEIADLRDRLKAFTKKAAQGG